MHQPPLNKFQRKQQQLAVIPVIYLVESGHGQNKEVCKLAQIQNQELRFYAIPIKL
jgi:hypothetical protein